MSIGNLPSEDREELDQLIRGLSTVFERDSIQLDEVEDLTDHRLIYEYLDDLRQDPPAQPESALKDKLVNSASILGRSLFGRMSPEITIDADRGIVDYKLQVDGMPILLEIKPPFKAKRRNGSTLEIEKVDLDWRDYREQIDRYREDNEYLIFTDLNKWYFFSKRRKGSTITDEPYELTDVYDDLSQVGNLREYLERVEHQSNRGELGSEFLDGIENWADELNSLEFKDQYTERQQTEATIKFINKFIFIQTLDDHFLIDFNWIEKRWNQKQRDWKSIGKRRVLSKFLREVNEWFYEYYDTELFEENILEDYLVQSDENIEDFYRRLPRVLGLEDWQTGFGNYRGITGFPYRQIDEDIFGQAYERYLAERREEEGIYYTRKHVTRYMVEQVVGKKMDDHIEELETALEREDFDQAKKALNNFVNIKIVDPACGSGSFLIKALDVIWNRYNEVINILEQQEYLEFNGTLDITEEQRKGAEAVQKLWDTLDYDGERDLIAKVLLRHIHGCDLDADALSVAKVNMWLESIKKVPEQYRYDDLPEGSGYILPNLEVNLQHGDSLIGLPSDRTCETLSDAYEENLKDLSELREHYIDDHMREGAAEDLVERQEELREELDDMFIEYLEEESTLDTSVTEDTETFHWPVGFWHAYFDEEGKPKESKGFDCVVGNPPYVNAIYRNRYFTDAENEFWKHSFRSASGAYDLYLLFIEQGFNITTNEGSVSFIVPNKHLAIPYAEEFRNLILDEEYRIRNITDVSQLNVFEDPSVYPLIPHYEKKSPSEDTEIILNKPTSKEYLGDPEHNYAHAHDSLDKLDQNIWSFLLLRDTDLFWDIYEGCQKLDDIGTVQASSTASESEEFTIALSEDNPDESNKKFIKTGAVDPFLTTWEFKSVRHQGSDYDQPVLDTTHEIITDLRREQYNKPKLVFAKVASILEAFPDVDGTYASVDTNFFYDGNENMLYYAGLVNSHVGNFLYSGLFGALRMRDGDFQFQAPQIELIPIPAASEVENSDIEEMLDITGQLMDYKHQRERLLNIWEKKADNLSDTNRSLAEILEQDREFIQQGNYELAWTSDVTFYPSDDQDILTKEYEEFVVEGSDDHMALTIYGRDNRSDDEIYTIEFNNRDLCDHVLFSMRLNLFETRKHDDTLEDVLNKTEVPIIRRNSAETTPNIIEQVERQYLQKVESNYSEVNPEPKLLALEGYISDLRTELNILVFDLYDIDQFAASNILDDLEVPNKEKENLLTLIE